MSSDPSDTHLLRAVAGTIDCDEAELLASRRLDGELYADDEPLLAAHLEECPGCRRNYESWRTHSNELDKGLGKLWPHSDVMQSRPKIPTTRLRMRKCMWVPVGMVASQVLALLGLTAYFVFFGLPVSAPPNTTRAKTQPPPAPEPQAVAAAVTHGDKQPAPAPSLPAENAVQPELAVAPASPVAPLPPAPVAEIAQATFEAVLPGKEIDNLSMTYRIRSATGGGQAEEAGRVFLLGDILNGRGIVRLVEDSGRKRDVAQGDVPLLLHAPLRAMVERFIQECARPELRARLAAAQRKAEGDVSPPLEIKR